MRHGLSLIALSPLALVLCWPGAVHAQSAPGSAGRDAGGVLPDIEFAADVQMRSIRFHAAPRAEVRLSGGPRARTRHETLDSFADPVQAGRTYRDATLRTTFSVTLFDPFAADEDGAAPPTGTAATAPQPPTEDIP